MSLLQTAQNSWQSKVGDKDVDKFTVAGKMGGSTPNSKRPSRKESEMNAVNETHQPTVIFFINIKYITVDSGNSKLGFVTNFVY